MAIGLGYRVSFSGMITFRRRREHPFRRGGAAARGDARRDRYALSRARPHRGKPCEPAYVLETAKKLAEVKSVDLERVAAVTTANFDGSSAPAHRIGDG